MNGVIFVICAACVALCLGQRCSGPEDKRVYTFGVTTVNRPYMFVNDDGEVEGFFIDVIRAVCLTACKKCEFVWFKDRKWCWDPTRMQGIGLNNRYFDVCVGWVGTKQRELVYSIFATFSKERPSALFVHKESNITTFDPDHHKIGFVQSHRASELCLKEKKGWDSKKATIYNNWHDVRDKILDGEIEVGFLVEAEWLFRGDLRKISESVTCATTGHSLMMRKDVAPDYAWFQPALKKVMGSRYYKLMCNIAKRAYGGDPLCIETQ